MGTRAEVHTHGCANVRTATESPCVVCRTCGREAPFAHHLCRGRACPPGPHVGPLGAVVWLYRNCDPHFAGGETETWKGLLIGLRAPNWPILGSGLELEVSHSEPLSGTTCGPKPQSFQNVRGSSAVCDAMCPSLGLGLLVGLYCMVPEALPSTEVPSSPLKREPGAFPTLLPSLRLIGSL